MEILINLETITAMHNFDEMPASEIKQLTGIVVGRVDRRIDTTVMRSTDRKF